MRILFVSNYYPPYEVGGWEQLCRDVVEEFERRGYTIAVLTSNRGVTRGAAQREAKIQRVLRLIPDYQSRLSPMLQSFLTRRRDERWNRIVLRGAVEQFTPDMIFFWNIEGLPHELALDAESMPGVGVAYWLAGPSPARADAIWRYWQHAPGKRTGLAYAKSLVARLALAQLRREGKPVRPQLRHVAVVSDYVRTMGLADGTLPDHTEIIPNGVELEEFRRPLRSVEPGQLRLLLAGRLGPDKGIHTALEAISTLHKLGQLQGIVLTIVGSGSAAYQQKLLNYAEQNHIADHLRFVDWVPRTQMPAVMAGADVLLMPSIYPEALPRVALEAMASGLAVIATAVGGTPEVVRHQETGLLFQPGDAADLARQIVCVATDAGLRQRIMSQGQELVMAHFGLKQMVDRLEAFLTSSLEQTQNERHAA